MGNFLASNKSSHQHLVVDDSKLNRTVLKDYLINAGISTDIAYNGKIALNMSEKYHYDVIWMDLKMPVMDGEECSKKLRESGYGGKIIMVSGANDERVFRLQSEKIINDLILKPFSYNQVKFFAIKHK